MSDSSCSLVSAGENTRKAQYFHRGGDHSREPSGISYKQDHDDPGADPAADEAAAEASAVFAVAVATAEAVGAAVAGTAAGAAADTTSAAVTAADTASAAGTGAGGERHGAAGSRRSGSVNPPSRSAACHR